MADMQALESARSMNESDVGLDIDLELVDGESPDLLEAGSRLGARHCGQLAEKILLTSPVGYDRAVAPDPGLVGGVAGVVVPGPLRAGQLGEDDRGELVAVWDSSRAST